MGNIYTSDYLKKHEVREKLFKDKREALNFKKALKAQGFVVTWKKWDFSGLGGASAYEVRGVRKRKGSQRSKTTSGAVFLFPDRTWDRER